MVWGLPGLGRGLLISGTALTVVVMAGFLIDLLSLLGVGVQGVCDTVLIDATGLGIDSRLSTAAPPGACVVEARGPRELILYASLAKERLVIIAHYFRSEEGNPGGLGVPVGMSPLLALKSPLFTLLSTSGETGGKEYTVLRPLVARLLPLRDGVEVLLVTCNLPGLDRFVKGLVDRGALTVAWTTPSNLSPDIATMVALHSLGFASLSEYCENSGLVDCY